MRPRFLVGMVLGGLLFAACGSAAAPTTTPQASTPATASAAAAAPVPVAASVASVGPGTPSPGSAAPAAAGDAATWCAIVIDINTKAGYMVDKTYVNPPTSAMLKQSTLEGIARSDEIMAATPAAIHNAMAAELAYFKVFAEWAAVHGWEAPATTPGYPLPPAGYAATVQPLVPFQEQACGIKFGK